ncbi:MAG: hypothetical protein JW891_07405 [Candidatus Lokiarchaeota archaeon]|nr:hypothetical protein [Candidatus Lokiarchaeota archaeon]
MFNIEDFQDNAILAQVIEKLNKFYAKEKKVKISKVLTDTVEPLLEEGELAIPVTYLLSIIAEHDIESLSKSILSKVKSFLTSENEKLKTNSILILGFKMLANPNYKQDLIPEFLPLLVDNSEDIRHNAHYFIGELIDAEPTFACQHKDVLISALMMEKNEENIHSLLKCLTSCENFSFKQYYELKSILKRLVIEHEDENFLKIHPILIETIRNVFPTLRERVSQDSENDAIAKNLEDLFIMKRHDFSEIAKTQTISPKEFWQQIKENALKEDEIYVYTKSNKTKEVVFFELEKQKVLHFFERDKKITSEEISKVFLDVCKSPSILKKLMNVLVRLNHVKGYYSKLGFFYPETHIKNSLVADFQKSGMVSMKNYEFLPPALVLQTIAQLSEELNHTYLAGKNDQFFFWLKKIRDQINSEAARNSSIDLKPFRERLKDEQFIVLIKNLPRDYLTNLHKGTNWLTNIGLTKIKSEVDNSRIIGFFDLTKVSKKLNIVKILLMDVLEQHIDLRSGIWDKNKEVFYYSKFVKDKIDDLGTIKEEEEKRKKINELAETLNIDKNIILTKIDENLQLIGKEIKQKEQLSISEYLGKLGMEQEGFLDFVRDLGLNYFVKGDLLYLSPDKIEDAKKGIASTILEKAKANDFITFGHFDANSELIEELIKKLQVDGKIKGVFYKEDGELRFYTALGIKNMMLENSLMFSFYDIFYGKDLTEDEISLMKEVFDELINQKRLIGVFEQDSLTFSSDEVIFVTDYNTVVHDFEKMVKSYIERFEKELTMVKKILTKRREIIYPQEIKLIQEIIDKINVSYVKWRAQINSVIRKTNSKILKDQGYSMKRYQGLAENKKSEIKSFKDDLHVLDIVSDFNKWVEFFNELELTYGKIIFLQKRLITDPEDIESEQKLEELLENLGLLE